LDLVTHILRSALHDWLNKGEIRTYFHGELTLSHILIIGCGGIGKHVASLYQQQSSKVYALSHSKENQQALAAHDINVLAGNLDEPDTLPPLPSKAALVYYFAPPPSEGVTDEWARNFIQAVGEEYPARLVYISTTGVYGDQQGGWVDENTPVNPQTDRSRRRLDAEQAFRAWGKQHEISVVILRVAGIYGPNRLPIDAVIQGRPVVRAVEAPMSNRIHSEDLAHICVAAMEKGKAGAIYNVCDGQESTMSHYFNAIADQMNVPRPPEISWAEAQGTLSPAMLSYLAESRRVDNSKMMEELEITLLYPTLEEGLPNCFEQSD
jgi:nucleoside-diphosphate-sugar epimerase